MTDQLSLDTVLSSAPHFDGADIVQERDRPRLTKQIKAVYDLISDRRWRTLREMADALETQGQHAPEASVSAQLRNLRKQRFGGHVIEREHVGEGLYRYRLAP